MFFRFLALLLLELAIAETPLGTGLVFAEEQTRTGERSRELLAGDRPARHALPERPSQEITTCGDFQATAGPAANGFDEPALAVSGLGMAAERGSVGVRLARQHFVPAPTRLGSARDPPLAA
jgi:hypothetical protein